MIVTVTASACASLKEISSVWCDAPVRRERRRQLVSVHGRRRVLQPLRDHERGEAGDHEQREDDPRDRVAPRRTRARTVRRAINAGGRFGQSSPPRAKRSTVSERNPSRSVSSESTSSGAMLPRLHSVPKRFSSQTCCSLKRRVEDQALGVDRVRDLVDQAGAHFAVGAVDPGGARLACLGDHLPGAGVEVAFDLLDPHVRRHDEVGVLAAHLGQHDELA